jgi:hypothetical protein
MARLFLAEGETFGTIGPFDNTDIIGTNSNEIVYVAENGLATFDPSFNRGGDEIVVTGISAAFEGARSGSLFVITGNLGAEINIPIGTAGTTITFNDGSFTLVFDGTNVLLGDQVITNTPEPLDSLQAMEALSLAIGADAPPSSETTPGSEFSTFG